MPVKKKASPKKKAVKAEVVLPTGGLPSENEDN